MAKARLICGVLLVGMVFAGIVMDGQGRASSTVTLAELRDRNRPLLIFTPSTKDVRLLDQLGMLAAHSKEAAERDMVAIEVPESGQDGAARRFSEREAVNARKTFQVQAGEFRVILVGKDGGEKLRSSLPIPFERLRAVIDAMPMRQAEMQGRK